MDEQANQAIEPVTTTPDPVVADNTPTTEPPQMESTQAPIEPIPTPPTTPLTEPVFEPIETPTEAPTAQMGRNEPLPEPTPSVEVAPVEEPQPASIQPAQPPQEAAPQTLQGTVQPEPIPTPASPMPAQAQVPPPQNIVGLILTKARAVIQLRKQKKLIKIMSLFAKQTSITNDAVEKLLHVSDATATRYLSELEKQRKITQSGKTGHAVTYTKR